MSALIYPAIFNGVDLTTVPGLTVLMTDPYKPPKRNVDFSGIARTNESKVNSAFYTEKEIIVRVGVTRANRNLLEQSLDVLNGLLQGVEKPLILNQSGTQRQYFATLIDTPVNNDGGSYIELDLTFGLSDRYGYDLAATLVLAISTYTSANRSDGLNFGGSALWQRPIITLTYTAVTTGTNQTVTIGNSQTGQQVAITRNWAAGDVIQIGSLDSNGRYLKTVKVNGVEVNPIGAIPEWQNGSGYWYYSDTFAARTFTGLITNINRYV